VDINSASNGPSGSSKSVSVNCDSGMIAVGGGASVNTDGAAITQSFPADADTWTARAVDFSGSWTITAYVLCVPQVA
jgi:hypothetical protein